MLCPVDERLGSQKGSGLISSAAEEQMTLGSIEDGFECVDAQSSLESCEFESASFGVAFSSSCNALRKRRASSLDRMVKHS